MIFIFYIAVCDDDPTALRLIANKIENEFKSQGQEVSLKPYSSGRLLEQDIAKGHHYDILFLDIDMPSINGISLSARLRKKEVSSLIVFVSSHEEYVYSSFKVRPFRFIRKAKFRQEIPETVKALCMELAGYPIDYVVFSNKSSMVRIDVTQVVYVEADNQAIHIVAAERSFDFKYKISDAEALLGDHGFIRTHKSYLVNYRFISYVAKDQVFLDSGEALPVSRYRLGNVKEQFLLLSRESRKAENPT